MKIQFKSFVALLVALAGLVMLGSARAAGPVRINVDAGNPPFMSVQDGKAVGVYPALMSAVFARMNVPVSIVGKPWKRALLEIDEGTAGLGGLYQNEERLKKYDYSDAMFSEKVAVFYNKEKPIDFKSLSDLRGKRVGVLLGWSYGEAFDAARKEGLFSVEEVTSDVANAKKLSWRRLDAVLMIEESGNAVIRAENIANIEQSPVYLVFNTAHLAFNKSSRRTELLAEFNRVLSGMRRDGTLDSIVTRELSRYR